MSDDRRRTRIRGDLWEPIIRDWAIRDYLIILRLGSEVKSNWRRRRNRLIEVNKGPVGDRLEPI